MSRANWSALFEPSLFFESYKNYLQVDIVAADADDLLSWRGWVESRLRFLTLKVEFINITKICNSGLFIYECVILDCD